jgi:hypothetical protein
VKPHRSLAVVSPVRQHDIGAEAARLRREVERRAREAELLAVALRDHIADLRAERDELAAEVERLREQARRRDIDPFLWRGLKPPR